MKTTLIPEGLIVEPETEFEIQYLRKFAIGTPIAFLKHGISIATVVGLKVKFPVPEETTDELIDDLKRC